MEWTNEDDKNFLEANLFLCIAIFKCLLLFERLQRPAYFAAAI